MMENLYLKVVCKKLRISIENYMRMVLMINRSIPGTDPGMLFFYLISDFAI